MNDFVRTMELLRQGGVPTRLVDPATVNFWLLKGYSPERIAAQIYSVKSNA